MWNDLHNKTATVKVNISLLVNMCNVQSGPQLNISMYVIYTYRW